MLIVRLKRCECAMSDGRLDEAFELAQANDLRADRRGQELVGRLARALADRGREHAAAGRSLEAAADCEKAALLGGNTPEVAQLRSELSEAITARQAAERLNGQALAAARRHVDAGQLSVGEQLLATAPADGRAEAIKQDLAERRAALASALAKASAAFDANDWETAIDHLWAVKGQFPADHALRTLSARISQHVSARITRAIEAGRLDQAASLLARIDRLGHPSVELDGMRRTLQQCRLALDLVHAADAGRATEILRRLVPTWPNATWMAATADQLRSLAAALEELRAGPLGLAGLAAAPQDAAETLPPAPFAAAVRRPEPVRVPPANQAGPVGSRFQLHVDGIGSFQVVSGSVVTIGPVSASSSPDIPLLAGAGVPVLTLTRSDEDYVLECREPVLVNGKAASRKVLVNGDKIAFGARCRLTFRRPSAASATAVLDLSGVRLPRGDVRHVILLDREILIGPGSTAHVRCDELAAPSVLQPGAGRLMLRSAESVQVDGKPAPKPAELMAGSHVRIGPLSFVVTRE